MSQELWTAVDRFVNDTLIPQDPVLDAALADGDTAGLPAISVTPAQGKLLMLLARIQGARRILELGTLAGYSTIWLARGLPADGRLISLEVDENAVRVSRANVERAGLSDRVEIRHGDALAALEALANDGAEPFDLVFIDADKDRYPLYLPWVVRLTRPGGVIVGDNVVRDGTVVDPSKGDAGSAGVHRLHELLATEDRLEATTIQTVGDKGYDGFTLARVKD
jgi:predicted O-methyltransferase YrrM